MAELEPGGALESADTIAPGAGRGDVLAPGARVGRYVVVGALARGGMGAVYKAFDPELDRPVAVKIVESSADDEAPESAQQLRVRVAREAQAIAKLSHPNVVAVHDVGIEDGRVFIAMEFVDGVTLRAWVRRRERGWRELVSMFVLAGRGLAAAHAAGLIHRDVKPENVLVGDDGRPRVLDFGLVRAVGETAAPPLRAPSRPRPRRDSLEGSGALSTPLTRAGEIMGTPGYMAPEQYVGIDADDKSDQFSFCVALYEALFGVRPFRGHTLAEIRSATLLGEPEPGVRRARVPARLRAIVVRGLTVHKDDRHPSMDALIAALERELSGTRRKLALAAAGALALLAVAVAVGTSRRVPAALAVPQPCQDSARKLEGAWDPSARAALAAAFASRASAQARSLADRVAGDFDRFADAWVGQHRAVCEATRVHGEQSEQALDLRMRCLDRQLAEVRELIGVLIDADAATLNRAAVLSGRLPELADCDDLRALETVAPPPTDPAALAEIQAVESTLARVRAFTNAGKLGEASALMARAREAALALAYEPLIARAYLVEHDIANAGGDGAAAREAALETLVRAERVGDEVLRAGALGSLSFAVGYHLGQPAQGLAYGRQAQALLDRLGGHLTLRAEVLSKLGAVEHARGRFAAAVDYLSEALRGSERAFGPDSFEHVTVLNNLGSALTELGRSQEAVGHLERALAIVTRYFGPDHLYVPALATNLGIALHDLGDGEGAEREYRRAIAVYERKLGPSHALLAPPLVNLGDVLLERGELEAAAERYRRSAEIRARAFDADSPRVANGLFALGRALSRRGDHAAAIAALGRARAIWLAAHGPDHGDAVRASVQLAAALRRQGRLAAAGQTIREIRAAQVAGWEKGAGAAIVLVEEAELALARGRPADAVVALDAAIARAAFPIMRSADFAEARLLLARALAAAGQRDRAREAAAQAREAFLARRSLGSHRLSELDELIATLAP